MLLFESLSAGVLAIFVGLAAVLGIVSLYAIIVWPLTFWDLANLGLERFSSWVNPILWTVFLAGSFAGYFLFSGTAFKNPVKTRPRTDIVRQKR